MSDQHKVTTCEWQVSGMDCGACAGKIRDAVARLPGVSNVSLGVMNARLRLDLDPGQNKPAAVEAVVRSLGYGLDAKAGADIAPDQTASDHAASDHAGHDHASDGHSHSHDDPADRGKPWYQTAKGRLVIVTGMAMALAWLAEQLWPALGAWPFILACLLGLAPIARRAFAALRLGQPFTIESLMTLAAFGALFINAAEEAAMVIFLFAIGEVLEGVAANKARDGIRALSALVPRTALLVEGETSREVSADTLSVGQIVLVRPGDRIPADGVITQGEGGIDESPVTGESVPRSRGPGDEVFAGSINIDAALQLQVSKAASDNTIARIIRMVEEAEEARAPTERFIDRFSRWYMPAIVTLAVLVVVLPPLLAGQAWDIWLYRGLALLLIGCPCALVISVPASIASALSVGARRGLLLKGGAAVEAAAGVRAVAFDKTGTLTMGRPEVTDVIALAGQPSPEVIRLAAGVEAGSSHPLADAISRHAEGMALPKALDSRALAGKGVQALIEGRRLTVASPRHALADGALRPEDLAQAEALEAEGKTLAVLYAEGEALGLIALRDEPRADAAAAVQELRALGVTPLILTGDNPRAAAAIAARLGTEFQANMLPEDKLAKIKELANSGGVMMVGDGINDAPALKQASIGIAMGSGTDVALETADGAILRNRVGDVAAVIRLSRAAMGNIRQNVTLALGLKAVFLLTSIFGLTGLWVAILADTGATVLVTLNALRLLRFDPEAKG